VRNRYDVPFVLRNLPLVSTQAFYWNLDLRGLGFSSIMVVSYMAPIEGLDGCSELYLISCDVRLFNYFLKMVSTGGHCLILLIPQCRILH